MNAASRRPKIESPGSRRPGQFSISRLAFIAIATTMGCKTQPPPDRQRVEENLRRLVTYEKERLKGSDGVGFVAFGPVPQGRPWDRPSSVPAGTPVALVTDPHGVVHEQYEVVVDQKGRVSGIMAILGQDGGARVLSESRSPAWFEARATGRFGPGQRLECTSIRVELRGGDLFSDPKLVERTGPCEITSAQK